MEPLSLDNFIIGHWRRAVHGRRAVQALPPRSTDTKRFHPGFEEEEEEEEEEGGMVLSMMGIVLSSSSFGYSFVGIPILWHILKILHNLM